VDLAKASVPCKLRQVYYSPIIHAVRSLRTPDKTSRRTANRSASRQASRTPDACLLATHVECAIYGTDVANLRCARRPNATSLASRATPRRNARYELRCLEGNGVFSSLPRSVGFRPVCSPPAGAGTLVASTQARSHMIWSCSRSRRRIASWTRCQTPACIHS
jgi:hypothetical protein